MAVACYKIQSCAINCIAMSEGFCVIGSDDGSLRVWPLDFTDYLLEVSPSLLFFFLFPLGRKRIPHHVRQFVRRRIAHLRRIRNGNPSFA